MEFQVNKAIVDKCRGPDDSVFHGMY